MALTPNQIDDLVTLTTKKFKRYEWTDLSLGYQEYVSSTMIDPKKIVEDGGTEIQFQIQTKNTGNARVSGLFAKDITKVEDVMISASVPWAKQSANWSYDIDEPLFQSDRETIIKTLVVREHDAMNSMAELQEELFWSEPASSATTEPLGLPYWIQKSTSTADGAFNGANPTGFAAGCAGVSSTTYPRWRNWAFAWTNPTVDDLVRKVKKAMYSTHFRPPVPHPELGYGKADYQIFTTYRTVEPLERLAETRNDNLGSDVAKYIGQVTIGGVPVKAVPYLDENDTSDPVYGVNWKVFRPYVKKGASMRRSTPVPGGKDQHTVRTVFIDNWMNYICVNRRFCFVGSKA